WVDPGDAAHVDGEAGPVLAPEDVGARGDPRRAEGSPARRKRGDFAREVERLVPGDRGAAGRDALRGLLRGAAAGDEHDPAERHNSPHGGRVYCDHTVGLDPALGDLVSVLALERSRRPARAEERHAGRGDLRRRRLACALGDPEAPRDRPRRAGNARGRAGRAQPVAQPRARNRAAGRGAARGAEGPAQTPSDEAEQRRGRAAPGAEAPPQRRQAAAAPSTRLRKPRTSAKVFSGSSACDMCELSSITTYSEPGIPRAAASVIFGVTSSWRPPKTSVGTSICPSCPVMSQSLIVPITWNSLGPFIEW